MKKILKSIIAAGIMFGTGSISLSLASCGSGHKGGGGGVFNDFAKAANNDGKAIITSDKYKAFGATDYWGSAILDPTTISQKLVAMIDVTNPQVPKLAQDTSAAFEEAFSYDAKNTVALVMMKGKKGDPIGQVYNNSKAVFNAWEHKNYVSGNWNDYDDGASYNVSKFFNTIKTDQTQLVKIFGANTQANTLNYQGVSKFSINKISAKSHLDSPTGQTQWLTNLQAGAGGGFAISTDYTFTMTGSDSTSNEAVVNISTNFSTNSTTTTGPNASTMTAKSFNNTVITNAVTSDEIKTELNAFLGMNNPSDTSEGAHTFKQTWMGRFGFLPGGSPTLTLTSLSVDSVDTTTGVISLTAIGSSSSNNLGVGTTYHIKTNPLITDGFHSVKNQSEDKTAFARLSKANYGFSDSKVWGDGPFEQTMINIFHVQSTT